MHSNNDNKFKNYYEKLFQVYLNLKASLVPACVNCNYEWKMNIIKEGEIEKIFGESMEEFEKLRTKIERKINKCVVFGETSSGKSSMINATLGSVVLPEGFGSVSSCLVEIKAIPSNRSDKKSYLIVNGEEKETALLDQLNNLQSENPLPAGSHIDLFYDSENCPILRNDAVLIDTPGIDKEILSDELVEEYCNDADLIVMMVNSTSWLGTPVKQFIDRLRKCLTKLNLAIVVNYWDIVESRPNSERAKLQFRDCARDVLCKKLGYSDEEADKRIHFMSASERNLFNHNSETLQSKDRWQSRNEAFDRFKSFLQKQMEESSFERRYNYLVQMKNKLISVLNKCHSIISEMSRNIDQRSEEIREKFNDISELEKEIKTSTADIYPLAYDTFIEEALNIIRRTKESRNTEEDQLLKDELEDLLDDIMKKSKENLKANIKDCIKRTNDKYLAERIFITENIYFPLYFDKKSVAYEKEFGEILDKIRKRIEILCWVTIGLSVLTVAATLASGGIAGAILAPIDVAVGAIAGIGAGGAAIGATVGGTTSNKIVKNIKKPFKFIWNKETKPIRSAWKKLEKEICNSYRKFLNEIDSHLQTSILSLNLDLIKFQHELDSLNNEMIQFHDTFLSPTDSFIIVQ